MTQRATDDPSAETATGRTRSGADPSAPRAFAGDCDIWGVLNVTPDSFSDGGAFLSPDAALHQGIRLLRDGASVLDVGGESSRPPGATYGEVSEVSEAEELRRVIPVIEGLRACGARMSIDTVKAVVAERALLAGAQIVNDVSCGRSEALLRVTAEAGVELVLMHNRGRGERNPANTQYHDVVRQVRDELLAAVERAVAAGVSSDKIWIDPGIGFAKTARQSAQLLACTDVLVATGLRVLVGSSRKSFIGELVPLASGGVPPAEQRVGGTAASLAIAVWLGAQAVRVHDVCVMRQAALLALRLREARG